MNAALLALLLIPSAPAKTYNPLDTSDLEALAIKLKTHVALIKVTVKNTSDDLLEEPPRTVYGAVIGPDLLVTLPFPFDHAERITIVGPSGAAKGVSGAPILIDLIRRVALIRSAEPLSKIGLAPVGFAPPPESGDDCFALIATTPHAGVVHSNITALGDELGLFGHLKTGLKLSAAMPVFSAQAQLLGYSRTVAWDADPTMLIPSAKIEAARKAQGGPEGKPKR